MARSFLQMLSSGAIYSVVNLSSGAAGLLLLPLYARYLGTDGYGLISLMTSIGAFLTILLAQGLQGAWFRLRFNYNTAEELRRFETTLFLYSLGAGALIVLLLITFGKPLATTIAPNVPFTPFWTLVALAAAANVLTELYLRKLQAEERAFRYGALGISRVAARTLGIVLFIALLERGVAGKFEAEALVAGIAAIVAMVLLRPFSIKRFSRRILASSLVFALPLVPHSLAALTNDMIDRVLINKLLGLSETGIYSLTYQVIAVCTMIATSLNTAMSPTYMKSMKALEQAVVDEDQQVSQQLSEQVTRLGVKFVTVVAILILFVTAGTRELILIVGGEKFAASWPLVPILGAAALAWIYYFPFIQPAFFRASGVRRIFLITVVAGGVNIAANLLLIPAFGIQGAASATLLSNATLALGALYLGQKTFYLPYDKRVLLSVLFISNLIFATIWMMDASIGDIYLRAVVKFVAACIGTAILIHTADLPVADLMGKLKGRMRRRKSP